VVEIESGWSFYPNKLVIWCHPGLCRHVVFLYLFVGTMEMEEVGGGSFSEICSTGKIS
jgi:hypothetical protein